MPKTAGVRVLEVGSAPGEFLVGLHKRYGYIPYGVEYSEAGVAGNRELFVANNIDPNNVIHTDFFDDEFQRKFCGHYDIVVSRGFIEHFDNVEDVIDKHLNVLAEDGCLVVSIPNFGRRSLYGACASLFSKDLLKTHNTDIMSREAFCGLFSREDLYKLFCGYYGTIRLSLVGAGQNSAVRFAVRCFRKLQVVLNPVLRLVFRKRGWEGRTFSPFLLYIGLKRAGRSDVAKPM
jgi:SAM-dependent methyltransferase